MAARILKIAPDSPARDTVNSGARIIANGGVVVFPTRGLYGLGADALNEKAVDRIFKIKGRSTKKPVLVLIHESGHLERLVKDITPLSRRIMARFWPGRVTLVFEALDTLSPMLTAGTGKIGIRLSGHFVPKALAGALGSAITGTSANISGTPPSGDPDAVLESFQHGLGLILDGGKTTARSPSTVLDVTVTPFRVLREGMIPRDVLSAHCEVR